AVSPQRRAAVFQLPQLLGAGAQFRLDRADLLLGQHEFVEDHVGPTARRSHEVGLDISEADSQMVELACQKHRPRRRRVAYLAQAREKRTAFTDLEVSEGIAVLRDWRGGVIRKEAL